MTRADIINRARELWQAGEPLEIRITDQDLSDLASMGAQGADIDNGHLDMQIETVYGTVYLKY